MITLTTGATYPTLAALLDHLYASFRRLQRTPEWHRHVTGGVAFLELKISSRTDRWHPHIHALVEGRFFPHPILKAAWNRVTGEAQIVDIRPAGNSDALFRYVTKYASKPMDVSYLRIPHRLDEALTALKGRRLCTTWGAWRTFLVTESDDTAGWENIGELATYLLLAEAGDADAQAICTALAPDPTVIPKPRPPPPPTAPTPARENARQRQGTLFPLAPIRF
jgi:hypothetical protein